MYIYMLKKNKINSFQQLYVNDIAYYFKKSIYLFSYIYLLEEN